MGRLACSHSLAEHVLLGTHGESQRNDYFLLVTDRRSAGKFRDSVLAVGQFLPSVHVLGLLLLLSDVCAKCVCYAASGRNELELPRLSITGGAIPGVK